LGQIVNGFILLFVPAGHILEPGPLSSLKTSIVAHLGLTNGIHRLVGQLDDMEPVKGDLGVEAVEFTQNKKWQLKFMFRQPVKAIF
jgi:hypothetical protein